MAILYQLIVKKLIFIIIIIFLEATMGLSQVGCYLFFKVYSKEGELIQSSSDLGYKIMVKDLYNNRVMLKNNKSKHPSYRRYNFENGFDIFLGSGVPMILISIYLKDTKKRMEIKIICDGFRNIKIDTIHFEKGFYEIDVADILLEKYGGTLDKKGKVKVPIEKEPENGYYDITPIQWIRKNIYIKQN